MTRISRIIQGDTVILDSPDSGEHLEILETVRDGVGTLAVKGKLTPEMANDMEDEMTSMALLCRDIIFDMKDVSLISNSAIRKILEVQHVVDARNGNMTITNVSSSLYGTFEEMGLDSVFEIETVDERTGEDIL